MVKGKTAQPRTAMQEQIESEETTELQKGEQLDLIDVTPENAVEIIAQAKIYEKAKRERILIQRKEVEYKKIIKDLLLKANLPRNNDGEIIFKSGSFTITMSPRDEMVKVKDKSTEDEKADEEELTDNNL